VVGRDGGYVLKANRQTPRTVELVTTVLLHGQESRRAQRNTFDPSEDWDLQYPTVQETARLPSFTALSVDNFALLAPRVLLLGTVDDTLHLNPGIL
jgi:hypothetical protein